MWASDGFTSQNFCPIWLPHWPAWRWTISLILMWCDLRKVHSYHNAMIASVKYVWECKIYIVNQSFGLHCNGQKCTLQTIMRMHLERDPHLMGPIIRSIDHSIVGNLSFANLCVKNLLHSKQQLHAIVTFLIFQFCLFVTFLVKSWFRQS